MQVDFYHLTHVPLERVLPSVARRVVEGGGRLLIVSGEERQRAALDLLLWQPADSFLPHGQAGSGNDALQPILIAGEPVPGNAARNVAFADGVWRDAGLAFDRAFHFFDEGRIGEARSAWRTLAGRDGVERRYWKQNDAGRWEQAA